MSRTYKTRASGGRSESVIRPDMTRSFDTKIAVLLRDDLASWQRLNVTAFLVSGIAHVTPELMGEPYADADGTSTCRCSASR